jgi:hypothetical protein
LAIGQTSIPGDKLAETTPVFQRGVKAVRPDVMLALLISVPDAVMRHSGGLPQGLLQPCGKRHSGGPLQNITQ